ncbi:MAG: hypothetical protein ABSC15_15480 [Terriglobales bacterium]|jgi:hypothetical protein
MTEEPQTFLFAPEIEEAAVTMLWRQPDRLGQFLRELDPAVHITQPHLRYLLEAIDLAWRELGAVDFATVVTVIRELGRFEDCGGLEGLSELWSNGDCHVASPKEDPAIAEDRFNRIFLHYIEMLKTYALARKSDFHFSVTRFSSGGGELRPNKNKRRDTDAAFVGEVNVAGKLYRTAAYFSTDLGSIRLVLLPK